ncbi:MAG: hypothetical protein ACYTG0_22975, partial [Planctomycetota bacterium]
MKSAVARNLIRMALLAGFLSHAQAEPAELPEGQRTILAEIESRWWGWPAEPGPIVPRPKECTPWGQSWEISSREPVVVRLGLAASE